MRLIPKSKVDEAQLDRLSSFGAKVGAGLRGNKCFRKGFLWLSLYGRKHPKTTGALLLGVSCALLVGSSLLSKPSASEQNNKYFSPPSIEGPVNYDDSIRRTQEKIDALLIEAQSIGDSIGKLIERGSITRAESLYVINQTHYLSEISKIIQK